LAKHRRDPRIDNPEVGDLIIIRLPLRKFEHPNSSQESQMIFKVKTQKNRSTGTGPAIWPSASRWAAMGTLAIYSAVGSKYTIALAQDITRPTQDTAPSTQTQGSRPVVRFDIPAGPLDSVLATFPQITGIIRASPVCTQPSKPFRNCWRTRA
jgi:hypothetical protein